MTTNLGTRDISKGVSVGFARQGESTGSYDRMKSKVQEELKGHFRPEFLNRVDDIIVFHQLLREEIFTIVDLMVAKVDDRLRDRDMAIELRPNAKDLLAKRGYDPVLGARPLRRTIQREIEDSLSEKILFGELRPGQIVIVDVEGSIEGNAENAKFTFTGVPKPEAVPDAPAAELASEPVVTKSGAMGGPPSGPSPSDGGGGGTASAVG
jgi:ATP-dependent Clp protease ATP-binding subunit ClpC